MIATFAAVLVFVFVALAPAVEAADTLHSLQRLFRSEESKPIEQQSATTYVDLLRRIDTLFVTKPPASDFAALQTLRYEVVAAHTRVQTLDKPEGIRDEAIRLQEEARRKDEEAVRRQLEAQQEAQRREGERAEAVRKKNWGESITRLVIERKVSIGMTAEQARLAWGEPDRVHETTTLTGTREQWVYGSNRYLYFENGALSAIQQSR